MTPIAARGFLHTMIRVTDLDRSIDFYTRLIGLRLIRRRDIADRRITLALLAFDDGMDSPALELNHGWDRAAGEIGAGFGHVALAVRDVAGACRALAAEGVPIVREPVTPPGAMGPLAFIADPDGHEIELVERA